MATPVVSISRPHHARFNTATSIEMYFVDIVSFPFRAADFYGGGGGRGSCRFAPERGPKVCCTHARSSRRR